MINSEINLKLDDLSEPLKWLFNDAVYENDDMYEVAESSQDLQTDKLKIVNLEDELSAMKKRYDALEKNFENLNAETKG